MLDGARSNPDQFFVGIDPVHDAMIDVSRRAVAKPGRGGVTNVLFLRASLETLPDAFRGVADAVTVNFPWGSLLRAVARPDPLLLSRLAALLSPQGRLEVLVNLHPLRDRAHAARLGLSDAIITADRTRLVAAYRSAGLSLCAIEDVSRVDPGVTTRWGKKLKHGGREILRLKARHV